MPPSAYPEMILRPTGYIPARRRGIEDPSLSLPYGGEVHYQFWPPRDPPAFPPSARGELLLSGPYPTIPRPLPPFLEYLYQDKEAQTCLEPVPETLRPQLLHPPVDTPSTFVDEKVIKPEIDSFSTNDQAFSAQAEPLRAQARVDYVDQSANPVRAEGQRMPVQHPAAPTRSSDNDELNQVWRSALISAAENSDQLEAVMGPSSGNAATRPSTTLTNELWQGPHTPRLPIAAVNIPIIYTGEMVRPNAPFIFEWVSRCHPGGYRSHRLYIHAFRQDIGPLPAFPDAVNLRDYMSPQFWTAQTTLLANLATELRQRGFWKVSLSIIFNDLHEAVQSYDIFYLAVVQMALSPAINAAVIPRHVVARSDMMQTLSWFRGVLLSNIEVPTFMIKWLGDHFLFRYLRSGHMMTNPNPSRFFADILHLLSVIHERYAALIEVCKQRQFPPLAEEIFLFIPRSMRLCEALQTHMLRQLFPVKQPQFYVDAIKLFRFNVRMMLDDKGANGSPASSVERVHQYAMHWYTLLHRFPDVEAPLDPRLTTYPVRASYFDLRQGQYSRLWYPIFSIDQSEPMPFASSPETVSQGGNTQSAVVRPPDQSQNQTARDSTVRHPSASSPTNPSMKLLLPPTGALGSQVSPAEPKRYAAHLAPLPESPVSGWKMMESAEGPQLVEHLCAVPIDFILSPHVLEFKQVVQKWNFTISDEIFDSLSRKPNPTSGDPRIIKAGAYAVRFKPTQFPASSLNDWMAVECSWPEDHLFRCNEYAIEEVGEIPFGKDTPFDISHMLVRGVNKITMSSLKRKPIKTQIAFGIELICFRPFEVIESEVMKSVRSRDDSIAVIKNLIHGSEDAISGDLQMVGDSIKINVRDPIRASSMCDVPVRSIDCKHLEAFDLHTFVESRLRSNGPAKPDVWRCPVCRAGALPSALYVDAFLKDVGEEIRRRDPAAAIECRLVEVNGDGTWAVVEGASRPEQDDGVIVID